MQKKCVILKILKFLSGIGGSEPLLQFFLLHWTGLQFPLNMKLQNSLDYNDEPLLGPHLELD